MKSFLTYNCTLVNRRCDVVLHKDPLQSNIWRCKRRTSCYASTSYKKTSGRESKATDPIFSRTAGRVRDVFEALNRRDADSLSRLVDESIVYESIRLKRVGKEAVTQWYHETMTKCPAGTRFILDEILPLQHGGQCQVTVSWHVELAGAELPLSKSKACYIFSSSGLLLHIQEGSELPLDVALSALSLAAPALELTTPLLPTLMLAAQWGGPTTEGILRDLPLIGGLVRAEEQLQLTQREWNKRLESQQQKLQLQQQQQQQPQQQQQQQQPVPQYVQVSQDTSTPPSKLPQGLTMSPSNALPSLSRDSTKPIPTDYPVSGSSISNILDKIPKPIAAVDVVPTSSTKASVGKSSAEIWKELEDQINQGGMSKGRTTVMNASKESVIKPESNVNPKVEEKTVAQVVKDERSPSPSSGATPYSPYKALAKEKADPGLAPVKMFAALALTWMELGNGSKKTSS